MKIELRQLTKFFENGRVVLDNIDFADDIRTLALIGSSGGGKSTMLRILGGLIAPSSGEVIIDGTNVGGSDSALLNYRRKIGFVFQQGGLFNHLNAIDNIMLPLIKVHDFKKDEAKEKAENLLFKFGLQEEAKKMPHALSGGQRQRIAIAKAIAPNPRFLLLDEPTSALDPEYTTDVLNMINELREEGMNFVIVTHEMGFACQACDKMAFLYKGRIREYGDSQIKFNKPETEQLQTFLNKLLIWN